MIKKKNFLVVFLFAAATLFTACSDDDDGGTPPIIEPTGTLVVEDQTVMNGIINISSIEISNDGWLVIYRDNVGVIGTEVLGYAHVEEGTYEDVAVELEEDVLLADGEMLWAALHVDDDEDGIFDWDGITGTDIPLGIGVDRVVETFTVTIDPAGMSAVTAEDQAATDGTVTVANVHLEEAGWVVVHADGDDEGPGEVIGVSEVLTAGTHDDVVITLDDSAEVNVGDVLWVMLHADTGTAGVYEFDGTNGLDLPITTDDETVVMTSIIVTE